ncbi:hypothetical protein [Thalassobacillus sp. C254]|uniref:hypothetical protein n=1 Tax=Thalassobacillus sp. C254 TaxID=1225341 RepID=UPI0012ECF3EC|nr:hypothetical protein [Thalassobacillus sp. C254]
MRNLRGLTMNVLGVFFEEGPPSQKISRSSKKATSLTCLFFAAALFIDAILNIFLYNVILSSSFVILVFGLLLFFGCDYTISRKES